MKLGWIEKLVGLIENRPLSIGGWFISFGAIIVTRLFIEYLAFPNMERSIDSILAAALHTWLFFSISYLGLLMVVKFLTKEKTGAIAKILLWGQWIIILPPIIDKLIFKDRFFFSFYIFDSVKGLVSRLFHFFGPNPDFGITYGTRVEVLLVVILLSAYVFLKTRNIKRSIAGALLFYLVLFLLGCLPSLFAAVLYPFLTDDSTLRSSTVAKIFLSPLTVFSGKIRDLSSALHLKLSLIYNLVIFVELALLLFVYSKEKLVAILKNLRLPQIIFNIGLFFIGMGLAWHYYPQSMVIDFFSLIAAANLGLAIICAWLFSVFINDINDISIDQISNTDRPLVKKVFSIEQYRQYSYVFLALSLLCSIIINLGFFAFIVLYHLLTYVYSCYPFRLKRFAFISTILASFASMINLFLGFILISGQNQLHNFPWPVGFLLFIAYSLVLPLKDLKDYEGDKADNVYTFVVLVGPQKARLVLATLVFIFYLASVFILNEKSLFPFALVFGAASYYLISEDKISPRRLPWYVIGVVFLYVFVMGKKLFF